MSDNKEASAPLLLAAQKPAFRSGSWPYAPNELCPKCGVVLPCHAHQIPHPVDDKAVKP